MSGARRIPCTRALSPATVSTTWCTHPIHGTSSPIFLLTDEVVVTTAAGSLKVDVPVGTTGSAFIPNTILPLNLSPPVQPDIPNPPFPFPFPFPTPTTPFQLTLFSFNPAPVVVIDDHIVLPLLTGLNPLRVPASRPNAACFVPLSDAYARPLRLAAFRAAHDLGLQRSALAEGTYAWGGEVARFCWCDCRWYEHHAGGHRCVTGGLECSCLALSLICCWS